MAYGDHIDTGNQLVNTLYQELRKLARARLRRLRPGQTLQTTELVHEAYLRLQRKPGVRWNGKRHFFGAAAQAMRNILVESARRKGALKRGGDHVRVDVPISALADVAPWSAVRVLAVHQLLEGLRRSNPVHAEVVSLRVFGGLSLPEISEVMSLSLRTVERRWQAARAWLHTEMSTQMDA